MPSHLAGHPTGVGKQPRQVAHACAVAGHEQDGRHSGDDVTAR
ncbi:hypothetical protein [Ornithinimicrobium kibberense]